MNKKLFKYTSIKFIIVGIINTIIGTTTMFFCYNLLNLGYWISTIANYIVGSVVSFFLNKYFTFKSQKKSLKEVVLFIVNILTCYFIAYGLAKPIVKLFLEKSNNILRDNVAMVVGMILFVILNYLGQKFVVFKHNNNE